MTDATIYGVITPEGKLNKSINLHRRKPMVGAILLVEDSKRDAEALEVLLRSVGIANPIITLDNGRKTIDYLSGSGEFADRQRFPIPGVLLLDLRMPEVDGFDVLEWFKGQSQLKEILVVVLSAYDGVREVTHAYALGARSFLVKPCNRPDIQNLMKSYPGYWMYSSSMASEARG